MCAGILSACMSLCYVHVVSVESSKRALVNTLESIASEPFTVTVCGRDKVEDLPLFVLSMFPSQCYTKNWQEPQIYLNVHFKTGQSCFGRMYLPFVFKASQKQFKKKIQIA